MYTVEVIWYGWLRRIYCVHWWYYWCLCWEITYWYVVPVGGLASTLGLPHTLSTTEDEAGQTLAALGIGKVTTCGGVWRGTGGRTATNCETVSLVSATFYRWNTQLYTWIILFFTSRVIFCKYCEEWPIHARYNDCSLYQMYRYYRIGLYFFRFIWYKLRSNWNLTTESRRPPLDIESTGLTYSLKALSCTTRSFRSFLDVIKIWADVVDTRFKHLFR